MSRIYRCLHRSLGVGCLLLLGWNTAHADKIETADQAALPMMDCVINPSDVVDLGAAVSGKVVAIRADRSDRVSRDQVLVELESGVEQAALALANRRARLDTSVRLREEIAAFDRLTQRRTEELLRTAAVSQHDVDKIQSEARITALQVEQARDNRTLAQLERDRAAAQLALKTVRSPIDGVVMERFKSAGEFVDDEPLMRIARLDPLHIELIAPLEQQGLIRPGMSARVQPQSVHAESFTAVVERVDAVADAASGTFGVRLSVANPDYRISAGMRCQLEFLSQAMLTDQRPRRDSLGQCSESKQGQCTADLGSD